MIKITNLSKSFESNGEKTEIFDSFDFNIKGGEFIAVMGSSGSGKTTFLNMLAGLEPFEQGSVEINGTKLESLSSDRKTVFRGKNIGFIFQQFNLIQNLTVKENIDLVIDINKLERHFSTPDILKKIGVEKKINQYPFNLSGGEQQRVAIARAFVGKTNLILADEPTGNLDSKNSKIVMDLIVSLHKELNNTIVMITHDPLIASYADKTYILEDKKLKLNV